MDEFQIDQDRVTKTLDNIVKQISDNEDPVELDAYRRLFKQNVSIFKRAYVSAYLLKYFKNRSMQQLQKPLDMGSVFMSIGKSHRVFPRDIIGMILNKTDLERQDVGNIKVLDNYSFVNITSSKADKVIQTLDGMEYRGKTLKVNYAKTKTRSG